MSYGMGVKFNPDGTVIYDDYVREALLEAGLTADEVDGVFKDNERLERRIRETREAQSKEAQDKWVENYREKNRIQSRERMRRLRARKTVTPEA